MSVASLPARVCLFRVGDARFALDADRLEQVVPVGAITPLPRTRATVRGLLAHRGAVLPLIDLRALLGFATDRRGQQALLVRLGGQALALEVDETEAIRPGDADRLDPLPDDAPAPLRASAAGLLPTDGRSIDGRSNDGRILLDADALLERIRATMIVVTP